jgi:hypothetical protein
MKPPDFLNQKPETMNDTPRTDANARYINGFADQWVPRYVSEELERELTQLERERDKWKAKYIQQNKDLGCEMMDPNGTIWDHAKNLQDQIRAMTAHTQHSNT